MLPVCRCLLFTTAVTSADYDLGITLYSSQREASKQPEFSRASWVLGDSQCDHAILRMGMGITFREMGKNENVTGIVPKIAV